MMKRMIWILLFGALATRLPAQEPWSLDRCIRYALEHNLDLQVKNVETDIQRAELLQRRLAHLPLLSAQLVQDYNGGRATSASVSASLPLFEGFSRHFQRLSAQKGVEVAMLEAQDLRIALETDITRAYLELMLAKQMLNYACESHATIVRQRDRTAQLVEAGSQPKSALSEMEAQVAAERAEMVTAECRVRTATLALTRLMNLPSDTPFTTGERFGQDSVAVRVTLITDSQAERYLQTDPRIRGAQARIAQLRHQENGVVTESSHSGGFMSYHAFNGLTGQKLFSSRKHCCDGTYKPCAAVSSFDILKSPDYLPVLHLIRCILSHIP